MASGFCADWLLATPHGGSFTDGPEKRDLSAPHGKSAAGFRGTLPHDLAALLLANPGNFLAGSEQQGLPPGADPGAASQTAPLAAAADKLAALALAEATSGSHASPGELDQLIALWEEVLGGQISFG